MEIQGTTGGSTTSTQTIKKEQLLGKDDFLKLLVTQLKNQDPLKPLEDKEFIAQMAQFSSLEQISNLNETVEKGIEEGRALLNAINESIYTVSSSLLAQQNFQAVHLMGRNITAWLQQDGEQLVFEGTVEGVSFEGGRVQITVDGHKVYLDEIMQMELR